MTKCVSEVPVPGMQYWLNIQKSSNVILQNNKQIRKTI